MVQPTHTTEMSTLQTVKSSTQGLQALIAQALSTETGLVPMRGFKMDLSANRGFQKVFFSVTCECGTAALLSVEISHDKTVDEVKDALPSLVGRLEGQARSFRDMTCDIHRRMRMGPGEGR